MDYYKCENCGKVFDEFEMNFREAQIDKKCWCRACREAAQHSVQADEFSGHANNCVLRSGGYACTCGAAETTRR